MINTEDFKWKLGKIFYDLAEGKIGVLDAYEKHDAILKEYSDQANAKLVEENEAQSRVIRSYEKDAASFKAVRNNQYLLIESKDKTISQLQSELNAAKDRVRDLEGALGSAINGQMDSTKYERFMNLLNP